MWCKLLIKKLLIRRGVVSEMVTVIFPGSSLTPLHPQQGKEHRSIIFRSPLVAPPADRRPHSDLQDSYSLSPRHSAMFDQFLMLDDCTSIV